MDTEQHKYTWEKTKHWAQNSISIPGRKLYIGHRTALVYLGENYILGTEQHKYTWEKTIYWAQNSISIPVRKLYIGHRTA